MERTLSSPALYVHEIVTVTAAGWMQFFSFMCNGESYDYMFEVGAPNDTEQQARDQARRLQTLIRARRNFMRDVELNMEMPQ